MQLEADAKLAEEMQREEEAASACVAAARTAAGVGSNVMEGILEKKPVRGFGRFLGGDFKRRRIVLRRTGSPCFDHRVAPRRRRRHGGGHRWMLLGPTSAVREGGAAGDDATRCLTVVGEEGESLLQAGDAAERDAWVRETARLLHTLKAAAPDDACAGALAARRARRRAAERRGARGRAAPLRALHATAVTPREDEASCTRSTRCYWTARRAACRRRRRPSGCGGRAPPAVADERREQGLFWQPETIEHVEGAAWQLSRLRLRRRRERAPMPTVASGEALPELESGAPAASPAAAPAAAPEATRAAATSRDGAVSTTKDARRRADCRRACRRGAFGAATSWSGTWRCSAPPTRRRRRMSRGAADGGGGAATEIMPLRRRARRLRLRLRRRRRRRRGCRAAARRCSAQPRAGGAAADVVALRDMPTRWRRGNSASLRRRPPRPPPPRRPRRARARRPPRRRPAAMSGEDSPLPLIDPISSPGGWRYSRQVMKVAGDLAAPAAALDHCLGISGPFVFSQAPADAQPERWLTFRSAVPRRVVRRIVSLALAMPPALGAVGAHLSQYDQLRCTADGYDDALRGGLRCEVMKRMNSSAPAARPHRTRRRRERPRQRRRGGGGGGGAAAARGAGRGSSSWATTRRSTWRHTRCCAR